MRNMFLVLMGLLLTATLKGCNAEVQIEADATEVSERTDITNDSVVYYTHEEMTVSYEREGTEVLGSDTSNGIYVFSNEDSSDCALIQVLYMPNWELFTQYADITQFKELHDGYVVAVTSETFPETKLKEIADSVTEVSYVGVLDK